MNLSRLTFLLITLLAPQWALSQQRGASIRSVNFASFTYPLCPGIRREVLPKARTVSMKDGELEVARGVYGNEDPIAFSLSNVSYHDLTGDGKEEAIVTLGHLLYPHGSSACTFIYTWRRNEPRLLWRYESGSAAFGGLRKLSVGRGRLVIERYEPDRLMAHCCTEKYRRSVYRWDGKGFKKLKSEELVNDRRSAEFLGYQ